MANKSSLPTRTNLLRYKVALNSDSIVIIHVFDKLLLLLNSLGLVSLAKQYQSRLIPPFVDEFNLLNNFYK